VQENLDRRANYVVAAFIAGAAYAGGLRRLREISGIRACLPAFRCLTERGRSER
jgi:hypothetical protein